MATEKRSRKLHPIAVDKTIEESAEYQLSLLRAFELPPLCREVVVLRELHGHAVAEIAALLGISRSAVEKRLRRAERIRARKASSSMIS